MAGGGGGWGSERLNTDPGGRRERSQPQDHLQAQGSFPLCRALSSQVPSPSQGPPWRRGGVRGERPLPATEGGGGVGGC